MDITISEEHYQLAVKAVYATLSGSVSNLQRKLYWGYNRAAAAIYRMEKELIVTPMAPSGRRDVLPVYIHELWKEKQVEINDLKQQLKAVHDSRVEFVGYCRDVEEKGQINAVLENDCMIGQTWFMKGSPVAALIKYSEGVYKAEAVAQNSKIEFGTDDNEHWFAHDVPFYGLVQIDRIEEHGLIEWDIHFNDCWQGPFNSKSKCIQHLEDCIKEKREEEQD